MPRLWQLCDNAGFDATNILNKLRVWLAQDGVWNRVERSKDIADNCEAVVWESAMVCISALTAASEPTCRIMSMDGTIKNVYSVVTAP